MSSMVTTYPGVNEPVPPPYPRSSSLAPGSQQPPGFINLGNQAPGGQLPFVISPGLLASNQLPQGNVQVINPAVGATPTNFKEKARILGAIQIMIGLMHIGLGIILGLLGYSDGYTWGFASTAIIGGYPFWGGLCFIISGSLSISAFKQFSLCLIKSSMGMNIVSAIFAIIGVILSLVDVNINNSIHLNYWAVVSGVGISAMLIIFSILEFCVTCVTVHFTKFIITSIDRPFLVLSNAYAANPMTQGSSPAPPRNDAPPAYNPTY